MQFKAVYPISGEDLAALPVREIGPAVRFYQEQFGFSVLRIDDESAVVQRDDVQLGLVRKPDHRPEEAGSCCFAVSDIDAARAEMATRGAEVGEFGMDEWDGRKYRTFFLRENENGYCFCFSQPV